MTYVAQKLSGFDKSKVIGSGTTLDSARLRYTLGEKLDVNPKNVHAYVMGEHGDSQFVAWSYALQGVQPIYQMASRKDSKITFDDLAKIEDEVKNVAYEIIKCKKSTYYGIGMALTAITKAILENENSILTVSSYLNGVKLSKLSHRTRNHLNITDMQGKLLCPVQQFHTLMTGEYE